MPNRCLWAEAHPLLLEYHDNEWGVPVHDDLKLFEFLILEGFQAGLSWLTILKKRQSFREALEGFDAEKLARWGEAEITRAMRNEKIIKNRRKLEGAVANARAFLKVRESFGSFSEYMWGFVEGKPVKNAWNDPSLIPAETPLSRNISRDMKRRGFRFVGPVVIYSHMQAVGMVNDHLVDCFRYAEV
ncbi:MAG: DNA-3-methyladenine glycosylase [Synergistales bacterium]|nr:DNA-3-methyladenine glycosylase [Synergistales bacterium]HAG22882.1 DNA-3-methyladenine glycosylase I [Synergistaceae bacterium]